MPFNKAIIPLYLNSELMNNLFSVVVQEFVEIKSASTRDQVSVHLKTPVSELSYDLFGKYIQGDLEFQVLSEFVKQRTEEKISAVIVVLKQLKDILLAQNLLKYISDSRSFDSVEEGDFIDFPCHLTRNPVLQHAHNMVGAMEVNNVFTDVGDGAGLTEEDRQRHAQMLAFFKDNLEGCRNQKCLRYVANNICESDAKVIVPMKNCCMIDNEEYLLNGRVRIMGKVVKTTKKVSSNCDEAAVSADNHMKSPFQNISLMSGTVFDHLDYSHFSAIQNKFLTGSLSSLDFDRRLLEPNGDLYEIIPIVAYI